MHDATHLSAESCISIGAKKWKRIVYEPPQDRPRSSVNHPAFHVLESRLRLAWLDLALQVFPMFCQLFEHLAYIPGDKRRVLHFVDLSTIVKVNGTENTKQRNLPKVANRSSARCSPSSGNLTSTNYMQSRSRIQGTRTRGTSKSSKSTNPLLSATGNGLFSVAG